MKKKDEKTLEAVLYIIAIAIIICCMSSLPYWANYAVKVVAMGVLAYSSYMAFKKKETIRGLIFLILALIFQPFYTIPIGRVVWTCIEIGVIAYILYVLLHILTKKTKKSESTRKKK